MTSIMELEDKINHLKSLDEEYHIIFNRIFQTYTEKGTMAIPPDMQKKILQHFGAKDYTGKVIETPEETVNRIKEQKIVRTFNKWTGEGALFNYIRTSRPGMGKINLENEKKQLKQIINDSKKDCDFCQAEKYTPADVFSGEMGEYKGRVKGKNSITAANLAKYDIWSSLVIFNNHNPLEFNLEELSDYIDTAFNWFSKVFQQDNNYKFPFFVWNCLYKAGASQIHGHAQILMTKDIPYAKIESLHRAMTKYYQKHGNNYFSDLFKVYEGLGLGYQVQDVRIFASITPTKEKEIIIIPTHAPSESQSAKKVIFNTLRCFIDVLGVHSYNLSIYCPPRDQEYDFPYLVKIVDRGSIFRPTADMGGMELFGSTVVADDPYEIIHHIREYFKIHKIK
jgi:hypothetical protein